MTHHCHLCATPIADADPAALCPVCAAQEHPAPRTAGGLVDADICREHQRTVHVVTAMARDLARAQMRRLRDLRATSLADRQAHRRAGLLDLMAAADADLREIDATLVALAQVIDAGGADAAREAA